MATVNYQGPVPLPSVTVLPLRSEPWPTTPLTAKEPAFVLGAGAGAIYLLDAVLPGGAPGTAYSQTLAANGGTGPYTYAVTAGSLPAGLSLNSSTGVISGTPTGTGTATFTVTATDSTSATGSQSLSLTVAAAASGRGNYSFVA